MFFILWKYSCEIIILHITDKPPVWKKATTCLRTNPWWRPELFSQSLYHQPGYAHHPSSSALLCLWSVSSCVYACTRTVHMYTCVRGERCIVGELLLSWQGWVLIGTPSECYECWCLNENSTDRHTLIHSYGELQCPEGLQIVKAFTTLNAHAQSVRRPIMLVCLCVFVCACVTYVFIYVPTSACYVFLL